MDVHLVVDGLGGGSRLLLGYSDGLQRGRLEARQPEGRERQRLRDIHELDNAAGKRRTLGGGATGGGVAVPIFEPIIQAVWANVAPTTVLAPPSPEAKRQLACKSIDLQSEEAPSGAGKVITECFRVDTKGKIVDTRFRLVSREASDRQESLPRTKLEKTNKPELVNQSGASGRSYDRSFDARSAGPELNWQREYRAQHPE
jgi:hypothetical protein